MISTTGPEQLSKPRYWQTFLLNAPSYLDTQPAQDQPETSKAGEARAQQLEPLWTLHVDGSSNAAGSGSGLILVGPGGETIEYARRFSFGTTNNIAEYEALITGLELAREVGARRLAAYSDSELVVNQVKGEYEAKDPVMAKYPERVKSISSEFSSFEPSTERSKFKG